MYVANPLSEKQNCAYVEDGRNHTSVKDAYMTIESTHTQYLQN